MKSTNNPARSIFSPEGQAAAMRHVIDQVTCPGCERTHDVTPLHLGRMLGCDCGTDFLIGEPFLPCPQPTHVSGATPAVCRRRPYSAIVSLASVGLLSVAVVLGVVWTTSEESRTSVDVENLEWNQAAIVGPTALASPASGEPPPHRRRRSKVNLTLAQIEGLRSSPDSRAALVEARLWNDLLAEQDVPVTDERRLLLAAISRELVAKLAPPPSPPPACIAELRSLTRELREALDNEQIDRGRTLYQRVERVLQAHPRELAPFARGVQVLKDRLDDAERILAQAPRIEAMLREARRLASDDVTAALEREAWARFLAFHASLQPSERDHLDKLVRELQPVLLLARGVRAVDEAERCVREGDAETRDVLVAEARELLPGFAESEVLPLLRRADRTAQKTIPSQGRSTWGHSIAFGRQYERTLEAFAANKAAETIQSAEKALAILHSWRPQDFQQRVQILANVVLTLLEAESRYVREQQGDAASILALLDLARAWRNDPRWQELRKSLDSPSGTDTSAATPLGVKPRAA